MTEGFLFLVMVDLVIIHVEMCADGESVERASALRAMYPSASRVFAMRAQEITT